MKCDGCPALKNIKGTVGCNADQLHNRIEILKSEIAKSFKIKYKPKFQCRFADLIEMETREISNGKQD